MFTDEITVNPEYKYIDKDISSILDIRLHQENLRILNSIFTIAPIGATESTLVPFLNEEKTTNASSPTRTLLIPYLTGNNRDGHWVGIVVRFENTVVVRLEYYDSLVSPIASKLVQDLKQVYGDDLVNKIDEIRDNVIRQNDFSSCGPCMIENLVNAAKQTRNIAPISEIRKNHILLMQNDHNGQDFLERQQKNQCIVSRSQDTKNANVFNHCDPYIAQDDFSNKYMKEITEANIQRNDKTQRESFACNRVLKRTADYSDDSARKCVDDGNRLLMQHNIIEAINKYDQAIGVRPYAVAHYNKRIALSMQNNIESDSIEHKDLLINKVKACNLASQVDPYFVINIIATVPERRFSDDSSAEEPDEDFNALYEKSVNNNDWPFTTRRKKTIQLKRELKNLDQKWPYANQDAADSIVVDPLLSKILENGFEVYDQDKLSTIAVSVGLNRMYSLSTRKNNSLILELGSQVNTREIKYKKFGYYWECAWYTKDGEEVNIAYVRKFYKQLKTKDPDLAKKFIAQEERKVTECYVPYQYIREYAKDHPRTKEVIQEFRDSNATAMIYLHLVDADVLDFNKVYSAYLRIIEGCYEPPTIMSTGYEFPENSESIAYHLLGHMERMHRVITAFHIPLGTYYPEPNMCVLIPQNCETVTESFIDRNRGNGRTLESPILLSNIQNNRQNVRSIFSEDNPIIINVPSRFKVSNKTKQQIKFSHDINKDFASLTYDDINKYEHQVSQSHSGNLAWTKSLFINRSIEYDNNYESDGECINDKNDKPLKGTYQQCIQLITNIRKDHDVELSQTKLANRISQDNVNNIVKAIENIKQFQEDFNKKHDITLEEQKFIDIMKARKISYDSLSRESLLMVINDPIMYSITNPTFPKKLLKKLIALLSDAWETEIENLNKEHGKSLYSIVYWDWSKIQFLGSDDIINVVNRFDGTDIFQQIEDLYDHDNKLGHDIVDEILASKEDLTSIDFEDLSNQYAHFVQLPDQESYGIEMMGENIVDIIVRNHNYDFDDFRVGFAMAKRAGLIDSDWSTPSSDSDGYGISLDEDS